VRKKAKPIVTSKVYFEPAIISLLVERDLSDKNCSPLETKFNEERGETVQINFNSSDNDDMSEYVEKKISQEADNSQGKEIEETNEDSLSEISFIGYMSCDSAPVPIISTYSMTEDHFHWAVEQLVFGRLNDNMCEKNDEKSCESGDAKIDSLLVDNVEERNKRYKSDIEDVDMELQSLASPTFSLLQSQFTQMIVVGQFNLAFIVTLLYAQRFFFLFYFILFFEEESISSLSISMLLMKNTIMSVLKEN
jgi:hypothetical protein